MPLDASCSSAIDERHHWLGIAFALGDAGRKQLVDLRQFVGAEAHVESTQVVLEITDTLCAGNGNDVFALGQHPGKGQLRRRATLPFRQILDVLSQLKIPRERLSLKTGVRMPPVILGKVRWFLNRSREKAATTGCRRRTRASCGRSPASHYAPHHETKVSIRTEAQ